MRPDAEKYLDEIPSWYRKKHTLGQLRNWLKAMGQPDHTLKIIHVAGTNGKGSVCNDLTYMLMEAGYRVGTFISPHLTDVRERCLLDGEMVDRKLFQASFDRVYEIVQKRMEQKSCHPTYFEFLFLVSIDVFSRWKPDYVILETGLGGTYDTTNVIEAPLACVITSISMDHIQYLGSTLTAIAGHKAGIIKPGVPVIYDDNRPEVSAVIRQQAKQKHAPRYPVSELDSYRELAFAAPYQAMNAAMAVKVLDVLMIPGITTARCRQGLAKAVWPGRMEQAGPDIWLDGAHNPGGVEAFIRAAKKLQEESSGNIQILFAAVDDKDYNEMIRMLCRELVVDRVTIARIQSERSMESDILAECFRQSGCSKAECYPDTGQALDAALMYKTDVDRLFVIGSLYLIGEIKEQIRRKENAGLRGRNQPL
ncbi:MAG: bifunctional folylpolyglutamate synthase/dihydrofolate synthase [Lachnospiraceae bacterium]